MDVNMESLPLLEDYLSPRAKVAKMLADIDAASSPATERSFTSRRDATTTRMRPSPTPMPRDVERQLLSSSEDEDMSPALPVGRTARRMMHQPAIDEDELYDATPAKSRSTLAMPATPSSSMQPPPRRSPGLFVSPAVSGSAFGSDDDLPINPTGTARLAALVAAKRAERLEREKLEKKQAHKQKVAEDSSNLPEQMIGDEDATTQQDVEKILSDAAKPTRKASKKAMLEMQRETQRLAREQALAHQMKTKKKFSTSDLFARFNFRQTIPQQEATSGSSSVPNSDGFSPARVTREPFSTPPSSPPTTPFDTQKAMVDRGALARMMPAREDSINTIASLPDSDGENELPAVDDIIKQSMVAKATAKQPRPESPSKSAAQRFRLKLKQLPAKPADSDEELDIVQPMPAHLRAFDRVKSVTSKGEVHSKAIHALKHLAHLTHDDTTVRGRKIKPTVAPGTVNAGLLATARAHARDAQQKRLAELQAKGIIILNAEEQEREADQMENLLEQARREAEELRKKEKAAARKGDNEVNLEASDDEDEDWQDSELEEDQASEADADDESDSETNELVDDVAADDEEEQEEEEQSTDELDPTAEAISAPAHRHRRVRIVLDDDEDDIEAEVNPAMPAAEDQPDEEDPFAAFGFDNNGPALMSPTQAFAATMQTPTQLTQSQSLSSSLRPPPPTFGQLPSQVQVESQSQLVTASQLQNETQAVRLDWETQMPETPLAESRKIQLPFETPGWEPSQDAGLPSPWTAMRDVATTSADDHETQSTVLQRISQTPELSVQKPKGRLTKGRRIVLEESPAPVKQVKNAFSEMQKLRLQSLNSTDRAAAEKEMKEMMDDQAEESEDEYAGLGGDDSNMIAPETEEDRAMIDESNIEIDEKQAQDMAKFYAERQRAAEEEATSKLFKDLTTGALRRRQGVGWELDEDEDELDARRRQIRQREEARKNRLLLQDDNVRGLLNGKGDSQAREAFLRTIGDDDEDIEELSQLEPVDEESAEAPLQEVNGNKRKLDGSQEDLSQVKVRRVHENHVFSRPTSMLQIQESLSFLLEEPAHALQGPSFIDEDESVERDDNDNDEVELENARDNNGGYAPDQIRMPPPPLPTDRLPAAQRRTPAKPAMIDRLSLRRGSSSSTSSSNTSWSAWSTGAGPNKAPSLLRRATSNLSAGNTNERGVSYGSNARAAAPVVKTGGSKKSSLAYQSRAQERKAIVDRAEKKKEDNRRRIAEIRRQQGGGLVGSGFQGGHWE